MTNQSIEPAISESVNRFLKNYSQQVKAETAKATAISPGTVSRSAIAQQVAARVKLMFDNMERKLCAPQPVIVACPRCDYERIMTGPLKETADVQYNLKFICPQCFKHDGVAMVMREQNK